MIVHPAWRLASRCLFLLLLLAACGDDESDEDSGIAEDGGREGERDGGRTDGGLEDGGDGPLEDAAAEPDAEADAAIDEGTGGSRLKWIGYQVDGVAAGTEIYDAELQARCDWMVTSEPDASEVTLHCVPNGFGELYYRDADCTAPIARIRAVDSGSCASAPLDTGSIVRLAGPENCEGIQTAVRELGEALDLDTVYRIPYGGDGSCVEDTASGATFFEALPAPYTELVSARIEIEPTSDPELDLEIIAADDGSRFHRRLRWADGQSCEPVPIDSSRQVQPCIPRSALNATINTYVDSDCSEPIFTGTVKPECDAPEWQWGLVMTLVDGCERVSGLFELGEPITDFYVGPPDACMEGTNPLPDHWRSFASASERALSSLPQTTRAWVGTGRIKREHIATEDGAPIRPALGFWDEELELECYPRKFADGITRCFSADFFSEQGYYADDDCTVPAYVTLTGGCNPSADTPRVRAEQEAGPNGCSDVISKVVRMVRHTAAVYRNDDGCVEVTLDPSEAAYIDGASLEPSDYAEVTVVEP